MASRVPAVSPFVNSDSPLSIVIGSGPVPKIIQIRPWLALAGSVLATILLGWYLVATLYLVFRDEMLSRLLNQQTEMQYAYEDRLAALRNQIDKVTSRQLLDQNSLEGKLHELISRQAQLETRHAIVASLAEQPALVGKSIAPRSVTRAADAKLRTPDGAGTVSAFAPISGKPIPQEPFEIRSFAPRDPLATGGPEKRMNQSSLANPAYPAPLPPAAIAVSAARDIADRMEQQQIAALDGMERSLREKARRWSAIFTETGLDAERFVSFDKSADKRLAAQGGPLVPIKPGKNMGVFEHKLSQLQFTMKQAERMRRIVSVLPIERPMPMEYETTSGFGARTDPFTRSMAMHTGIDFRAPSGTLVRVTAPGKVIEADHVGGYGKMVEIDHGNGISSRYAHLSLIDVEVGQTLSKGAIIGRVGSTGRSTGPHLHYETRIDGDVTDPSRFIRAGQKFGVH
ncbi:MAG: peptidoglycan DD-metalloendopeptidase family protein [Beijerinckiaceae bacterium]